ncbi:DUF3127 domain-containing protein [Rubellicoccus peritrichatus]|uniref:DUF3127 domain-containing protein n=1 Tax=Rubellicoccus peritrichatus TaxID=3080537 RepID=A0AAQ3L5M9_9BACT|nr:DUF3127 domain-containing protein [Puniceicoccus sp. CR14]WOO39267.1 DUF3127 domain-containing protein [Puniceicoccus sp. CR14]
MFELSGKVKEIFDEQTFGSGFTKREFVITTAEKYPQDVQFELVKDKIALLSSVSKGDQVTVSFDVRGREWKGRYFVNLSAWKIQAGESGGAKAEDGPPLEHYDAVGGDADDVPF